MNELGKPKHKPSNRFAKTIICHYTLVFAAVLAISCGKLESIAQNNDSTENLADGRRGATQNDQPYFTEGFEGVEKLSYTDGYLQTSNGRWHLGDALAMEGDKKDKRLGKISIRIRNNGHARMEFDLPNGASLVRVSHARYSDWDGNDYHWQLNASTDGGKTWQQIGETVSTEVYELEPVEFELDIEGKVRFEIRKTKDGGSGGKHRINFDDFTVYAHGNAPPGGAKPAKDPDAPTSSTTTRRAPASTPAPSGSRANPNLDAGLPVDGDPSDDLVIEREQYVVSYNPERHIANWASWHLAAGDYGSTRRTNGYAPDPVLIDLEKERELGFVPTPSDYRGSGYQRGHLVRSFERTATITDNQATFYMTNITPQSEALNMGPWLEFEDWCQLQCRGKGRELYIIAGSVFENGKTPKTIGRGIAVPDAYFKIALVLERGQTPGTVDKNAIVAAVLMPNGNVVSGAWKDYLTSVDEIEAVTGYDFLSTLKNDVEKLLESQVYSGN